MKERDSVLKTAIKNKSIHGRQHFVMLRNKVVMKLRKAKADFLLILKPLQPQHTQARGEHANFTQKGPGTTGIRTQRRQC